MFEVEGLKTRQKTVWREGSGRHHRTRLTANIPRTSHELSQSRAVFFSLDQLQAVHVQDSGDEISIRHVLNQFVDSENVRSEEIDRTGECRWIPSIGFTRFVPAFEQDRKHRREKDGRFRGAEHPHNILLTAVGTVWTGAAACTTSM